MEKIVEAIALNIVNVFKARDVPTGTEVIADDSVKHSFVEFFWHLSYLMIKSNTLTLIYNRRQLRISDAFTFILLKARQKRPKEEIMISEKI